MWKQRLISWGWLWVGVELSVSKGRRTYSTSTPNRQGRQGSAVLNSALKVTIVLLGLVAVTRLEGKSIGSVVVT
jgi:hypothetical protein